MSGLVQRARGNRFLGNFSKLISGEAVITGCAFAVLAVNTRALGLEALGVLLLIQATCVLIARAVSVQSWQAVVKFGAMTLADRGPRDLKRVWRLGFSLDIGLSAVAACLAALLFTSAPGVIGLSPEEGEQALLFAVLLVFQGSTAALGALRLAERFGLSVVIRAAQSVLLLINAVVLMQLDAPLKVYLVTIPILTALAPVTMNLAGWWVVGRLVNSITPGERDDRLRMRDVASFILGMSLTGTLNVIRQRGEIVIVGSLLGPAAAGAFGIAQGVASILLRAIEAASQVIYPDLSRKIAEQRLDAALALVVGSTKIAAVAAACTLAAMALFGNGFLSSVFGSAAERSFASLILLGIAASLYASIFSMSSLVQLVHGAGVFFRLNIVATFVFIAGAFIGAVVFGNGGGGAAAAGLCLLVLQLRLLRKLDRELRGLA